MKKTEHHEERLLRTDALAKYLDCTPRHIYNLRKAGKIKAITLGRSVRWRLSEVLASLVAE